MRPSSCGSRLLFLLPLWLAAGAAAARTESALPSFSEVRALYRGSDGRLLDRGGALLQEQRLTWAGRALSWVSLAEVGPAMREAVVEVEDRRFRSHAGVDLRAIAGAAWQDLFQGGRRGASTITMQTVGLLETGTSSGGRRSIAGKLRQVARAWELEKSWSKEQILEAYLNLVSFRGELRGLRAASRALFGKDPHGLLERESFLLAVLLRAPGMSAPAAGARLCRLAAGRRPSLGPCPELRRFALTALEGPHAPFAGPAMAPHLARRLLSPSRPRLRSTIDARLQAAALQAVRDQLRGLESRNARDAAVVVASNRTGEVLAYVGSSGPFSGAAEVDMAQTRRQAGSSLKPFLYALAFDKGYIRPESWLLDEPFEIGLERGSYEPGNYDHSFHGPVPARVALASSLNVPAVRLLGLVGVDGFRDLLDRLGFRALESGEHYGPSLALGTADVALADLVQAYMALANGGRWRPLRFLPDDPAPPARRLIGARAAGEVAGILSDRGFRSLTFGWDSLLATPYPAAVKTGTSKDMRDNWCVGFSRDFTVGVWVGNASGEPMWQVSGVSGAAPIWRALMDRLHKRRAAPSAPFLLASGPPGDLDRADFGRILYPTEGAVIALDPDIPEAHQRVSLEAEGGRLALDGVPLAGDLWKPVKGRHRLELSDASGKVLDALSFEVR